MDERDYLIILYDIYGELFNDKQREYFEEYYFNNLSLGEISDNMGVSRNAVHKNIINVCIKLKFYEEKLKLFDKNRKINDIIDCMNEGDIKERLRGVLE